MQGALGLKITKMKQLWAKTQGLERVMPTHLCKDDEKA